MPRRFLAIRTVALTHIKSTALHVMEWTAVEATRAARLSMARTLL
jgi:hypothetical protein